MGAPSNQVILAGGAGFLGRHLAHRLATRGWAPIVLSRRPPQAPPPPGISIRGWENLTETLEGAAGVINLAGENIGAKRWTPTRKAMLWSSRIDPARRLAAALASCKDRPPVLIQASATGCYGPRPLPPLSEDAPLGTGFLADLCRAWEAEALCAERLGVRVVLPRLGIVLARDGGALPRMILPIRAYLGTLLGDGRQGFPWIHLEDALDLILRALEDPTWVGPIHATAPDVLDHATFQRTLARHLRRPLWPIPPSLTRAALRLLTGELGEALLLQGAFVHPTRALERGFTFRFPTLAMALDDLLGEDQASSAFKK